jgi:hypothetical protein
MNKINLVLSLLFAGNCFASQGSDIDSVKNSAALANSVSAVSVIDVPAEAKKGCEKPIGCQFYIESLREYNQRYNTSMILPEKNEVADLILLQEIQEIVKTFNFIDKAGTLIEPTINAKSGKLNLALAQEDNECTDFLVARSIVASYEQPNPRGPLGLLEKYNAMKKGDFYCIECNTTVQPNIPHINKNWKK